ncbi:Vomp family autotransporter [Bartonella vinsonii]|nr:Vomp family autotransporter [Bartonella vinsonii]
MKKYSTPNLVKAVSLGTVIATLLSSVSPVFAAGVSTTGGLIRNSSGADVPYPYGSHGSIVFAGDNDYCGVDNVVGRGGKQQDGVTNRITAKEQYNRFVDNKEFGNRNPYGTTTEKVTWANNSTTTPSGGYMGALTSGFQNAMPEAYGIYSFATGCGSAATGNYSTVFGAGATAKAGGAQAFGVSALASGIASVAMGVDSEASGKSAVAMGGLAKASGKNSISIGEDSQATMDDAIAIGSNTEGSGINSVAIGNIASASGYNSVAIGLKTKASKEYTVAIGSKAEAQALGSIAIGGGEPAENGQDREVIAKGKNSIAIGSHTFAETDHSVAVGINAQVRVTDGVAVGGGSVSRVERGVLGYDPVTNATTKKDTLAWKSTGGDFSVGNTNQKLTRQITNVAAGSEDTDAVNVAQLKALRNVIAGEGAGGSWNLSVNDRDSAAVNGDNTVDFSVTKNGVGEDNLKIKVEREGENNNKHNVKFTLSDELNLTSVTTGKSSLSDSGLEITGGPSVKSDGISAGNKKITGVMAGTENGDAVNFGQLKEIKDQIAGGWKLSVNNENPTDVKAGNTVDFSVQNNNEAGQDNLKITKGDDNKIKFALSDALKLTSVTTGQSTMSSDGFVITGGPSMGMGGIKAGSKKIKEVAEGTDDTDAVNFGQLKKIEDKIAGNNLVQWVEKGNLITIGKEKGGNVINITNQSGDTRTISGVSDGDIDESSTEAVNGSQINKISQDVAKFFGGEASFNDGTFRGPTYNLSLIVEDGQVAETKFYDVGSALKGLNANVKSVNTHLSNVVNDFSNVFNDFSKDALLWSNKEQAFVAQHQEGEALRDSKITYLLDGDITEDSTDAINGSQINKISKGVAKIFGGKTEFKNGVFTNPEYKLTTIDEDGTVALIKYHDVGTALDVVNKNVFAVDHRITVGFLDIAEYFGGGAKYEKGKWQAPTFTISQIDNDGSSSEKSYDNVADAFEGVNTTFTKIHNQISNITENSLVQWDEDQKRITIGKEKGGSLINIANNENRVRIISGVSGGKITADSTEAVNGAQLYETNQKISELDNDFADISTNISNYFGGGADIFDGTAPTYTIQNNNYSDVGSAFSAVNTSITEISNQITNAAKNSLVKQEGENSLITVGKATGGTKISIANKSGEARTISSVKAAEQDDEAVNKKQLDNRIADINNNINNIKNVSDFAVLYDKNSDNSVNYNSVTLGGNKSKEQVALRNVKDGVISEQSHDAINGSQINKISQDIAQYFGGGAKFKDGAFVRPKYNLSIVFEDGKVGKINYYDVGSALKGLDTNFNSVNTRITNVANDFSQKINNFSKDALLWSEEDKAFVARHEKDGKKTNSKLKFLLDGEIAANSTDAITGNQLYLMSTQLANYFGGGAGYKDGKWNAPNFTISQFNADGSVGEKKSYNNVADALGGVNNGMININNRIEDVINKVDSDALKWNSDQQAYDASHTGQPSKIINVADGKIEKDSKDAVNGGQLWQTNERVAGVEKDIKHITNRVDNISTTVTDLGKDVYNIENKVDNIENTVGELADGVVLYDKDNNGKKTNKITLAGGDASEPVLIDNVADGKIEKGSKEAVNGGQLRDYTEQQMKIILDESKHYTDQRVNNIVVDAIDDAVNQANHYTNIKFEALNYNIENVRKEARRAAAIGLAVSNLRYNDTPGKLSVAFGSGLWRSQSAFAFGAGYTSEKGNIRSNLSVTSSGGHWGIGAGLNMTLN